MARNEHPARFVIDFMGELHTKFDLAKADADIADALTRIERQRKLIYRMARDGHDTATARDLLQTLVETLRRMEDHRGILVAELGRSNDVAPAFLAGPCRDSP